MTVRTTYLWECPQPGCYWLGPGRTDWQEALHDGYQHNTTQHATEEAPC